MEGFIKVCNIDGIYYPILHDDFFDVSLPLQICEACKKTLCAKCLNPFHIVHECKYKYFCVSHQQYICTQCEGDKKEKISKALKDRITAMKRSRNKNL
jgi:hypothetical protein